ncbi:hypothetical protein LOTGIDRAFT_124873 [Lottia gigantea]|uniref:Uncharacterized protein n=1 Tax=Lottia gigantea TaxID=225164 RepID=V3ZEV6_LOTGI|nr:hypothetical protein LOTGIDRAFT_124873 [Lottia gigantea]ESO89683.1 hypothetical protein LOTGIDRAFT_124873 [Lottia gigantea]
MEPRPSVQYGQSGRRLSHFSRSSISGLSLGQKGIFNHVKVQNTYRLAPETKERFNACQAEKVIKGVLDSYLGGEDYDSKFCSKVVQDLSSIIKDQMKDLGFSHRYKFICEVIIGENKNQGISMASRCLWGSDVDNYASATYTKGNIMCVATVFATYFE